MVWDIQGLTKPFYRNVSKGVMSTIYEATHSMLEVTLLS